MRESIASIRLLTQSTKQAHVLQTSNSSSSTMSAKLSVTWWPAELLGVKPHHVQHLNHFLCCCFVFRMQTDALIQRTIRRVFAERATLTIAHRLDTIIFSDKILAMAQGQVRAQLGQTQQQL
jgi:hypothetical protein